MLKFFNSEQNSSKQVEKKLDSPELDCVDMFVVGGGNKCPIPQQSLLRQASSEYICEAN